MSNKKISFMLGVVLGMFVLIPCAPAGMTDKTNPKDEAFRLAREGLNRFPTLENSQPMEDWWLKAKRQLNAKRFNAILVVGIRNPAARRGWEIINKSHSTRVVFDGADDARQDLISRAGTAECQNGDLIHFIRYYQYVVIDGTKYEIYVDVR